MAAAYAVVLHVAVLAPVPLVWVLLAARRRWQAVRTDCHVSCRDRSERSAGSARLRLPHGFLWGSATAAHQVEGNNTNNDWWAAEQAGCCPSQSGLACDQFNRFDEDFALLAGAWAELRTALASSGAASSRAPAS